MTRVRVSVPNVVATPSDDRAAANALAPAAVEATTVTASTTITPGLTTVIVCVGAVAVASVLSWAAFKLFDPTPIKVTSTYVPLAGFIIVATALERLLQPLSLFFFGTDGVPDPAPAANAAASAGADSTRPTAEVQQLAQTAADAKAKVQQRKEERTIVYWAIASCIAMVIAGCFGFMLVASIASTPVNTFFDIAVTGLAIGAGTKPLHDLFTSIQAKAASSSAS